ncbi:golgin candidate 1 isoform X2 [Ipomoea triloba]|uniref:golgin candidate 1 isoform X2 n=1 Tax=Ipomoea triloba TaxID=35885 RepID=UPI00125D1FD2|nr:golgin candidate 1 isoform X2 [Ipomoea triloba]
MASWLKAAEDLFEVVDRRAKIAAGEKVDEQPSSQTPVSNGQGSQPKRSRPRRKPQKRVSSNEKPNTFDTESTQTPKEMPELDVATNRDKDVMLVENNQTLPDKTTIKENQNVDGDGAAVDAPLSETIANNELNVSVNSTEAEAHGSDTNTVPLKSNDKHSENISEVHEGPTHHAASVDDNTSHNDGPVESSQAIVLDDAVPPKNNGHEELQSASGGDPGKVDKLVEDTNAKAEIVSDLNKLPEHKTSTTSMKVQEQLDEAQGLLKNTSSTGQSKEARLARVCAGLSSRLQEYKSENAQLEELLLSERELSKSYEARLKQLQKDLSEAKNEVSKVESSMAEALSAKNAEIEALVSSMDSLKKQTALSEGNLASLQANMEALMRNRELTETRMMQAVREELAAAERRAEEERAAHNATKMAAMEREVELEHRALEASTALARIQRTADERMTKAADLEQKVALLEVECATLNQELQDMEARVRRGQKKSPEDANQAIQAWQEEVERARQGQREADNKLASMEAEMQKLRVEMAAMKRDAEHYSRQEHMELEKRYRELTDLLYYKQTQLEAMATEKAAAEFQLEKEVKRLQEAQLEAERSRVSRRASTSWEEETDIKTLEPLPLHHRHMAAASIQLQKAAKLLDSGAVRATRFLWRYPTARVLLLFYLVFVHLFLMYLLHRLQEQADTLANKEVAMSMGLVNQTLP